MNSIKELCRKQPKKGQISLERHIDGRIMDIKEDDTKTLFWSHPYGLDGTDLGIRAVVGIAVTNEQDKRTL